MRVDAIETPELGDRSYVVSDGTCAVVVDPQRDTDRVESALAELGVPVSMVLETHLHNDDLTGGLALAHDRRDVRGGWPGRGRVVPPHGRRGGRPVGRQPERARVRDPGHTDTHLSYVISVGAGPPAVSPGSLLYGSVGRTDLLGSDRTDD